MIPGGHLSSASPGLPAPTSGRRGSRTLVAALVALSLVLLNGSCDDDGSGISSPWVDIGPPSELFHDIVLHDSRLLVAVGRNGVFGEEPAFTGPWSSLGLVSTDSRLIGLPYGASALLAVDSELLAGTWPSPYEDQHMVYRRSAGGWVDSDAGMGQRTSIYDLAMERDGTLWAASSRAVFASADTGKTWVEKGPWGPALKASLSQGPDRMWAGGLFGNRQPVLWRLSNAGVEWIYLASKVDSLDGVKGVNALGFSRGALLAAVGNHLYASRDSARTFHPILGAGGEIIFDVNPFDDGELVAAADSLYLSVDAGEHWTSAELPGSRLGPLVVDWKRRYLALAIQDDVGGTLYRRRF